MSTELTSNVTIWQVLVLSMMPIHAIAIDIPEDNRSLSYPPIVN